MRMSSAALSLMVALATARAAGAQDCQNGFHWTVGGANGGPSAGWSGGDLRASVIEEGHKRRPGTTQRTEVTVTLGQSLEPVMQEWLRAALDGESPVRDVDYVELNRDRSPRHAIRYRGSRITEIVFVPPSSKNPYVEGGG